MKLKFTLRLSKAPKGLLTWVCFDLCKPCGVEHDTRRAVGLSRIQRDIKAHQRTLILACMATGQDLSPANGVGVGVRFNQPCGEID